MLGKVTRPETEVLLGRRLHGSGEVNIIDLSAEVGLASTKEQMFSIVSMVNETMDASQVLATSTPAAD